MLQPSTTRVGGWGNVERLRSLTVRYESHSVTGSKPIAGMKKESDGGKACQDQEREKEEKEKDGHADRGSAIGQDIALSCSAEGDGLHNLLHSIWSSSPGLATISPITDNNSFYFSSKSRSK